MGRATYLVICCPMILAVVGLGSLVADKDCKVPTWLAALSDFVFRFVWMTYDRIFKSLFGDGERTQEKGCDEESELGDSWDKKKEFLSEAS